MRKANDEMRPLSFGSRPSHHFEVAEAIDSYLRAFGRDAGPFAAEVANLYRLTTAARDSDATDTTVFSSTPGTAAVVVTGEAVLARRATARQLLDAVTVVANELSAVTQPPRSAAAATSSASVPVAPQLTSTGPTRTLSSEALRSGSYEDTDEGAAHAEPEPYVDLTNETSADADSDTADQS